MLTLASKVCHRCCFREIRPTSYNCTQAQRKWYWTVTPRNSRIALTWPSSFRFYFRNRSCAHMDEIDYTVYPSDFVSITFFCSSFIAVSKITSVLGFKAKASRQRFWSFNGSKNRSVNSSTWLARSTKSSSLGSFLPARSWSFSITWWNVVKI